MEPKNDILKKMLAAIKSARLENDSNDLFPGILVNDELKFHLGYLHDNGYILEIDISDKDNIIRFMNMRLTTNGISLVKELEKTLTEKLADGLEKSELKPTKFFANLLASLLRLIRRKKN